MLGIGPGSSVRAPSAFNHQVISPAPFSSTVKGKAEKTTAVSHRPSNLMVSGREGGKNGRDVVAESWE